MELATPVGGRAIEDRSAITVAFPAIIAVVQVTWRPCVGNHKKNANTAPPQHGQYPFSQTDVTHIVAALQYSQNANPGNSNAGTTSAGHQLQHYRHHREPPTTLGHHVSQPPSGLLASSNNDNNSSNSGSSSSKSRK